MPYWFIPTPVGNTGRNEGGEVRPPVHPHACGEHPSLDFDMLSLAGSSPRLWGTLCIDPEKQEKNRFIPTPVGNTLTAFSNRFLRSVHRHACGEHYSW